MNVDDKVLTVSQIAEYVLRNFPEVKPKAVKVDALSFTLTIQDVPIEIKKLAGALSNKIQIRVGDTQDVTLLDVAGADFQLQYVVDFISGCIPIYKEARARQARLNDNRERARATNLKLGLVLQHPDKMGPLDEPIWLGLVHVRATQQEKFMIFLPPNMELEQAEAIAAFASRILQVIN